MSTRSCSVLLAALIAMFAFAGQANPIALIHSCGNFY